MSKLSVFFNDRPFRLSHMRAPRGYGSWAFEFEGRTVFSPSMTLSDAKKWVKTEVASAAPAGFNGAVEVKVLP